jgi:hypothetical protein
MRYYISLKVIFILSLDNCIFAKDATFPQALVSIEAGFALYENITKARNHPPTPINLDNTADMYGVAVDFIFSRLSITSEIQTFENNEKHKDSVNTPSATEMYLVLKGGLNILPSNWSIQLIPKIGGTYLKEDVRIDSSVITPTGFWPKEEIINLYKEEYKDMGFLYGGTVIWRTPIPEGKGGPIFVYNIFILSYFRNKFEKIKREDCSLRWRASFVPASPKEPKYCIFFVEMGIGWSKKSDGRKASYINIGAGLEVLRLSIK